MRAVDIILKKRNGGALTTEEISFFIEGYVNGKIPDYQASALLMAIYYKGMDSRETADLTMAMVNSGDRVDLSSIKGVKVDKHSTGGVGDTTTLIVAPLVAACGVPVAKMSGRGLGHTGGTLDKLESIPGFRIALSMDEFINAVQTANLAVISQSGNLVPADKLLYSLRDVTGTVDSLPLIASSIMSKKIAAGADAIVLDVKTGSGAFMQTVDDSFTLAKEMVEIGTRSGVNTTALISDMNQPLGMAVGNSLEVLEAIEVLKGQTKGPLKEVSLYLASYMLYTAGACDSKEEGRMMAEEALTSGRGLIKLGEMINLQGGNAEVINNLEFLPIASKVIPIKAPLEGYIASIDTQKIGLAALYLGAGRSTKDDVIDHSVGLVMRKRLGDFVSKGDTLADFYVNNDVGLQEASMVFEKGINIENRKPEPKPLIFGAVTKDGIIKSPIFP